MSTKLLSLLLESPAVFFSGEELSRQLNISRTAVWKQVNNLKEKGFQIESVPRKGYRLLNLPDKLYPQIFCQGLKTRVIKGPHYHFQQVDSTNKKLRELAEDGSPEGTTVIAEEQLQGRGRLERNWHSPPRMGIWLSLLLRPKLIPEESFCLTLLAGVAVQQSILQATGLEAKIKWPNDVLYQGKKICGILTEMKAEVDALHYILLGIGINVNQGEKVFPPQLTGASSLKIITGIAHDRNNLLKCLLQNLDALYITFLEQGFGPVKKLWEENNNTLQKQVFIHRDKSSFSARALKIDNRGRLVIKNHDSREETLTAGEVSLSNKTPGGKI